MFLTCFKEQFCNYAKDFGRLFNDTSILSAFNYFCGLLGFFHQPAVKLSALWTEFCRYQLRALPFGVMNVSPSWRPQFVKCVRPMVTDFQRWHANGVASSWINAERVDRRIIKYCSVLLLLPLLFACHCLSPAVWQLQYTVEFSNVTC